MNNFVTVNGSRKVISFSNDGKHYSSRLYVNNGETATPTNADHTTEKGARRWAKKVLKIGKVGG